MARRSTCVSAHRTLALTWLAVSFAAGPNAAQEPASATEEPLVTDRPDFTESAETVPRGRWQVESGITSTESDEVDGLSLGEVLVRAGIAERFELRLGIGSLERIDPAGPGGDVEGLADPSVGAKAVLRADSDGRIPSPQVAVLFGATLPIGSSELREPHAQPFAVLSASWTLSEVLSLGSNLGATLASDGGEQFAELSASVAAGYALSERWGAFVELFAFVPETEGGPETSYFDAGLTRLLSNDLQLDFRIGVGLDDDADDLFVGVGAAWRH